jgi:hypothetical protein
MIIHRNKKKRILDDMIGGKEIELRNVETSHFPLKCNQTLET